MPPLSYTSIPIADITDFCTWDIHPFLKGLSLPEDLATSIRRVGILHPPLLFSDQEKNYQVISGRKRIECSRLLGKSVISCAILAPDTPVAMILKTLLEEQTAYRPLSLPEAATFLNVCRKHLEPGEALSMLPKRYPSNKDPLHLLDILKFDTDILRRFHFGQLSEAIVPELLRMTQDDRNRIVELIDAFHLGGNKQRRLIGLCRDLVLRNSCTYASLLKEPDLVEVIEHSLMNIPQKTNRIFEILQKRCFPRSTEAKEDFEAQVRQLDLPKSFDLSPSPFFERDDVSLSIHFPDMAACKKVLPSLKDLINDGGNKSRS